MNNPDNLNGKIESSVDENKPVTPAKRTATPRVARKSPVKRAVAQKALVRAKKTETIAVVEVEANPVAEKTATEDNVAIAQDNVIADLINNEQVVSTVKDKKETKKLAKKLKNKKKMIAEKKQVKKTAKKVDELKDKLKKVKKKDAKKSVIKKVKSKLSDTEKTLKTKKAKLKKALKK